MAKWQNISDDHKNFNDKLAEFKLWLEILESKPAIILDDDNLDLNKKLSQLQSLYGSSDQTSSKISFLTSLGESLYPDTSATGRETIRQQLKEIRERYSKKSNILIKKYAYVKLKFERFLLIDGIR